MTALDTNVLVRLVTRDDPQMLARTVACVEADTCFVPLTVTLEVEWVLRAAYRMRPAAVAAVLSALMRLPRLVFEFEERVSVALAHLASGLDFADALHHASSGLALRLVTFDEAFRKRARAAALIPRVESV